MTTEDDFQRALDAHPDDWQTRMVFADWLEERGDPRGPGYRALGQNRCRPDHRLSGPWGWFAGHVSQGAAGRWLPHDWIGPAYLGQSWPSRRAAEDAAALAFAQLPPDRRAELLAGAVAQSA